MAEKSSQDAARLNELAEARTEESYMRTQLANERTFSAWIRTGLALLVAGFAATRLLDETEPAWLITLVGVALVVLSAVVFMHAYWSYRKARNSCSSRGTTTVATGLSLVLVVLSCVAAFLLINAQLAM